MGSCVAQIKFYVVRGNHDWHTNPGWLVVTHALKANPPRADRLSLPYVGACRVCVTDAEIAYYMNKRDERWTLPGPYYLISQPLCPDKSCNGTVDLVLTDSVILAPQATEAAVSSIMSDAASGDRSRARAASMLKTCFCCFLYSGAVPVGP